LVVVVVLAILVGLLLPVINGALNSAKQAAVQAEINQISQALANFKSNYGDYPPSRVYLSENGIFPTTGNNTVPIAPGDITVGQLGQRSLNALRKFFPRVVFTTQGLPPQIAAGNGNFWYDFNGNGVFDQSPYILEGHECLVFFLGGIPSQDPVSGAFGMNGFGKDPVNPFTNNVPGNLMYSANRQPPLYEFNTGRLFLDPNNGSHAQIGCVQNVWIPGYYDSLGNAPPTTNPGDPLNFFVYFSANGNGNYDPNDVNFLLEPDGSPVQPPPHPIGLYYSNTIWSAAPNPYSTTLTITLTGTVTYEKPQTFQLFSAGRDGQYGVGGQYISPSSLTSSASTPLMMDPTPAHTFAGPLFGPTTDQNIRIRERDNLTNFRSGTLQ
jgi:general secretion pathway protein G